MRLPIPIPLHIQRGQTITNERIFINSTVGKHETVSEYRKTDEGDDLELV